MTSKDPAPQRRRETRPRTNAFTVGVGSTFALHLKKARREAGLTQQELADLAGVDRVTIAKWESGGGGGARADQVAAVSAALNKANQAARRSARTHPGTLLYGPPKPDR